MSTLKKMVPMQERKALLSKRLDSYMSHEVSYQELMAYYPHTSEKLMLRVIESHALCMRMSK